MDSFTPAQKLFLAGYNCSQSVFAANAPRFGVDEKTALRIAEGLGGGVGRMREVCGAFAACAMLAGLARDAAAQPDGERKKAVYEFVQNLARDFVRLNGSIICREILDLQKGAPTPPSPDERTDRYYAERPCLRVVGNADAIARKI